MKFAPVLASALLLAACESSYNVQQEAEAPSATVAHTCPVSGKPAQSDVSLVHDGQTVNFCCEKCLKSFKEDPEQFMANYSADEDDVEEVKPSRTPRRVEGSASR